MHHFYMCLTSGNFKFFPGDKMAGKQNRDIGFGPKSGPSGGLNQYFSIPENPPLAQKFLHEPESRSSLSENISSSPVIPPVYPVKVKPVSFWGLVALIFFSVSGGPFGAEPAVATGGPFWALIAFFVFPIVWCIPEALMTSELSSLFPGNSGFTSWITASFNSPFLGYVEGFCSFVSCATNSSVYPHLFQSYLSVHFPILEDYSTVCMSVFIMCMAYINYRGLDIVSSMGLVLMILIMTPFFLMAIFGARSVDPQNWLVGMSTPPSVGSEDLLALFNVLFWNLNNWDSISTIAGEVSNPRKIIPKAMFMALLVIMSAYVVPLGIGIGWMTETNDLSVWKPGYFQAVAYEIGGTWLALWILLAAIVSCMGQFQALISSCAYQLEGMSELGWLPRWFNTQSRYDTPTVGLGIAVCIVLGLTQLQFIDILQYLNVVYAVAQSLEFSAFLWMRWKFADIPRPFKVPLGFAGCCLLMFLPYCFLLVIIGLPIATKRWDIVAVCVCTLTASFITYWALEFTRKHKIFSFYREPPRTIEEIVLFHKTPKRSPLQEALLHRHDNHSLDGLNLDT